MTEREPDISIENAYAISTALLQMRKADGEKLIGKNWGNQCCGPRHVDSAGHMLPEEVGHKDWNTARILGDSRYSEDRKWRC